MRSRTGVFWYSLGLTLLLLLPVVAATAFFLQQRQQQNALRQAAAAQSGLRIEPGAQDIWRLLLVVQQEEPAFVLARVDGPARTVTLCALPAELQVDAPAGTTTLGACANAAGPGRAAQLLCKTVATGESASPSLYYLAATPACWADCAGADAVARVDTASLLSRTQRAALGYAEESVAETDAETAAALIAAMQGELEEPAAKADVRAAVWAAFMRQNPQLAAAVPQAWRSYSARTLTDLLAADLAGMEDTLCYLTKQPSLTVDYLTAEAGMTGDEAYLTEDGLQTVRALLR